MRTHNILHVKENRKYIPIMPLDLALWLTYISSIYPCLEHIIMVLNMFKPFRFYCSRKESCKGNSALSVHL